jgi:hypothetical protein
VPRKTFVPTKQEVDNEKFNNLYSSPDIIRVIISRGMRWSEHRTHRRKRNAYRVLGGRSEIMRPLGIPRHRLENGIKIHIDPKETGRKGVD